MDIRKPIPDNRMFLETVAECPPLQSGFVYCTVNTLKCGSRRDVRLGNAPTVCNRCHE